MQFVDQVIIEIAAGKGGPGCVSFRREKYEPRGGPNGGDGGRGGSVVLRADGNVATLLDFRYHRHYKASNGQPGQGSNKSGAAGEDVIIKVPRGTLVYDGDSDEILGDLVDAGQEMVAAAGGKGGRGNTRFKTATNQAPRQFDVGMPGEARKLRLELKLLADIGLVGFPNAGKSTLLSRLSSARPKIADYPFTTLVPNLGIVDLGEFVSCTLADIPGLIEGASEGKGLGHAFLRHVERTRALIFLMDVSDEPLTRYRSLIAEVERYEERLAQVPRILCLSKMDLCSPDEALPDMGDLTILPISSVSGRGLDQLKGAMKLLLAETDES